MSLLLNKNVLKVLFLENRGKTIFWEKVAKHLEDNGHEIFWIVQNHKFIPSVGEVYQIPYYKEGMAFKKVQSQELDKIIRADRNLRYFKAKSDEHFYYYHEKLHEIVHKVKPNVAFGESTLFHELLVIDICKKADILYLHPTACRYPTGRFAFYKYDTLEPFSNCGVDILEEEATSIIEGIANRTTKPDYMALPPSIGFVERFKNKLRLASAHYGGERYNTPNPLVKMRLERNKEHFIERWDMVAGNVDVFEKEDKTYNILYPLQMQPEANIDVWGNPYNNQSEVIEKIISILKRGERLIIKPNPKSKYELNEEVLEITRKHVDKVILLKHSANMNDVISHIDFVVTVTGTISLEAFFSNKPFVLLGDSPLRYCFYDFECGINSFDDIRLGIEKAKKGGLCFSQEEKLQFLKYNYARSFRGMIGDGFQGRHFMENETNMQLIYKAFNKVLDEIQTFESI